MIIGRKDKLEESWHDFRQIQAAIIELENTQEHTAYECEVENLYFEALTLATTCINNKQCNARQNNTSQLQLDNGERQSSRDSTKNSKSQQPSSIVKLVPLNVPVFSGNWTSFHDMFLALIHTNTSLMNVQKFF